MNQDNVITLFSFRHQTLDKNFNELFSLHSLLSYDK